MEGKIFKHTMSGFDLRESEQSKVEVENTDSLALDELKEIVVKAGEAIAILVTDFEIKMGKPEIKLPTIATVYHIVHKLQEPDKKLDTNLDTEDANVEMTNEFLKTA